MKAINWQGVLDRFENDKLALGILVEKETRYGGYNNNGVGARKGDVAGSLQNRGYVMVRFEGKLYPAHRLIYAAINKVSVFGILDHINGIKTDNRIENLRCVTHSENSRNRDPKTTRNIRRRRNAWEAYFMISNKRVSKTFKTEVEALEYVEQFKKEHYTCEGRK